MKNNYYWVLVHCMDTVDENLKVHQHILNEFKVSDNLINYLIETDLMRFISNLDELEDIEKNRAMLIEQTIPDDNGIMRPVSEFKKWLKNNKEE